MLTVTVLGSESPTAGARYASAGYLVSINKRARLLVGAGAGILERISRSGLDLSTLEQMLLTDLQVDHTGDLPAVVANLYARNRRRPIRVTGPAGHPGAREFVRLLFGPDGAWRYLNAFEGFGIDAGDIPSDPADATIHPIPVDDSLEDLGLSIYASAVPCGTIRSVAYRVECDEQSAVFTGDVSGSAATLVTLSRNGSSIYTV